MLRMSSRACPLSQKSSMYSKNRIRWAVGVMLMLGFQWTAAAGVLLGGTRVILQEKDREASIPVKNTGDSPYVVQAWIDAGEGQNKTPFIVTPPLSRLDPGTENILRIVRLKGELPTDRESVFWLNAKEIPQKSSDENVLQIAVRTRIKLFYRPAGLPGKSVDARGQLEWVVSEGRDGQGVVLRIANPSAFHVTFTALDINAGRQVINADMVAPFGESSYPLTFLKTPQPIELSYTTLSDYGGETAEEKVRVPVGTKPVFVQAEAVAPPADGAKR